MIIIKWTKLRNTRYFSPRWAWLWSAHGGFWFLALSFRGDHRNSMTAWSLRQSSLAEENCGDTLLYALVALTCAFSSLSRQDYRGSQRNRWEDRRIQRKLAWNPKWAYWKNRLAQLTTERKQIATERDKFLSEIPQENRELWLSRHASDY